MDVHKTFTYLVGGLSAGTWGVLHPEGLQYRGDAQYQQATALPAAPVS